MRIEEQILLALLNAKNCIPKNSLIMHQLSLTTVKTTTMTEEQLFFNRFLKMIGLARVIRVKSFHCCPYFEVFCPHSSERQQSKCSGYLDLPCNFPLGFCTNLSLQNKQGIHIHDPQQQ